MGCTRRTRQPTPAKKDTHSESYDNTTPICPLYPYEKSLWSKALVPFEVGAREFKSVEIQVIESLPHFLPNFNTDGIEGAL
jgi:hypothetical protein